MKQTPDTLAVMFLASFPPIQSAIRVGQDGARIALDIPETEMPSIVRLLLMRGIVLRVTVEAAQISPLGTVPRKKKQPNLEWGDDGDTDSDTG